MTGHWPDTSEYPFSPHYFNINGYRLHYIDEGEGETILFVHGTPSWSFDFRYAIKRLRQHYRCIAIDHIGFGLSDKPEQYDYSTINHSRTLEKFVLEKGLTGITLAVHDFGGPIGLNFAIRHPGKIKQLVILNSWLWNCSNDPGFITLRRVLKSPLLPFLYRYLNFSPRFLLPRSFGDKKIPAKIRKQYTKPFAKPSQRNGTLAFARSLLHDQDWFGELWKKLHVLSEKPVLFIWGMKDAFITPRFLEKFQSGFTRFTTVRLEKSGHFPQEEQPQAVLEAMSGFLEVNVPLWLPETA